MAGLFFTIAAPLYILASDMWCLWFIHILVNTCYYLPSWLWLIVKWYLIVIFACICNWLHLIRISRLISIFSSIYKSVVYLLGRMFIQIVCSFLIGVTCLLTLSYKSSLYFLVTISYHKWLENVFFHFIGFLYVCFMVPAEAQMFLNLMKSSYLLLFGLFVLLGS